MISNYAEYHALGDCCHSIEDGDWIETKDQGDSGYRLLQISNIGLGSFRETNNYRWVTPETFKRLRCNAISVGDILIARMPEPTGRCWYVDQLPWPAITAVDVAIVRTNPKILDSLYCSYVLNSPQTLAAVASLTVGTTRTRIKRTDLASLEIPVPPILIQKQIAGALRTLDNRIALLREQNTTLEAIAQTLFKSWFVDFDPVHAKRQGLVPEGMDETTAAFFPDSFEESALGLVPKGWRCITLADAYEINPQRKLKKGEIAPYLDMASVPTTGHCAGSFIQREMGSGSKFQNGDTLLARITPCLENGKSAFVDFLDEDQIGWGSTEFLVLRPKSPLPEYHAYLLCRQKTFRDFAIQSMSGTSGRQRIQNDVLGRYLLALPTEKIALAFASIIQPIQQKISANHSQAQTLANLRDTLLPRLISGQLRLPEAELEMEEALACAC